MSQTPTGTRPDLVGDPPASAGSPSPHDADRDLALMVRGGATSTFGSALTGVTLAVLAVEHLHVTGLQAGLLSAAAAVPPLLFGLYAGALADRVACPRRVLITLQLLAGAVVLSVAAALVTGRLDLGVLVAAEVVGGAIACAAQSLFFTHLSGIVGRTGLGPARARLQSASYAASALGNAGAGSVVRLLGPGVALLADAVTYLVSAVCLRRIATPDANPAHGAGGVTATVHRDIAEGLRELVDGPMRPVLAYAVVAQLAFVGTTTLRALYLLRTLDLPVLVYGVPGLAAALLGTAGSAWAARRVRAGAHPGRLAAGCWAAGAVTTCLLPWAGGPLPVALAVVTVGIGVPILWGAAANVAVVTYLGAHVAPALLGRINAGFMVVTSFAAVAGALVAGRVADLVGVRGAVAGCAAVGLAGLVFLLPLMRRTDVTA